MKNHVDTMIFHTAICFCAKTNSYMVKEKSPMRISLRLFATKLLRNGDWKEVPPWKRYQQKLIEDLAVLEQEKERAIDLQQFEKLNGVDRLYSIRHPESKKNVRVIYTIEAGIIILLVAFLEKNSGDYQRAIKTAQNRLKWLES